MKDQINTIRAALEPLTNNSGVRKALTALSELEAMAGEPVLFVHPSTLAMDSAHVGAWKPGRELKGYIPLYTAAPVAQQPQADDYKAWYDEAMCASNEAGFVGASAGETIRQLARELATLKQPQAEHDLKDIRCGYCGYMTYHREHMGCIRAASKQPQAEAVPEGYRIVPDWKGYALLGSGQYLINHAANYDPEFGAELIITLATEKDREGGRKVGESRPNAEDLPPIQPEEMVIRIGFLNGDALFALEDQLADVRKVLEAAGKAAPQQAEAVPPDVTRRRAIREVADKLETLRTSAHFIFNNPPGETPQAVRDVIEWYAGSIIADIDALAAQGAKT